MASTCHLLRRLSRQSLHHFDFHCSKGCRLAHRLAFAAALPDLTSLRIEGMPDVCQEESTVARLANFTALTRLEVSSGRDAVLQQLKRAAGFNRADDELQRQYIGGNEPAHTPPTHEATAIKECLATARHMADALAHLTTLRSLTLHGCALPGTAALAGLTALTHLDLTGNHCVMGTDAEVAPAQLSALRYLSLSARAYDWLSQLAGLSLHTLLVHGCPVGLDQASEHKLITPALAALTTLQHLMLHDVNLNKMTLGRSTSLRCPRSRA